MVRNAILAHTMTRNNQRHGGRLQIAHPMVMVKVISLVLALSISRPLHSQESSEWKSTVERSLGARFDLRINASLYREHRCAYVRDIHVGAGEEKCRGILTSWFFDDNDDALQLAWWSSADRQVRALILACYLAFTTEPTSFVPPFARYAEVFEPSERRRRLEELAWVYTKTRWFASEIAKWVDLNLELDSVDTEATEKLRVYRHNSR